MGWSAIIFIELVLVFGAVLGWGFWQLRTLRQENEKAALREREAARASTETPDRSKPDA